MQSMREMLIGSMPDRWHALGGGGGGGGDSVTTIRYAPYIETIHEAFLETLHTKATTVGAVSPFSAYIDMDIETAFFGVGNAITSYTSLYEMFGAFMSGFSIDASWNEVMAATIGNAAVEDILTAEVALMEDDIDVNIIPRFQVGMRDINSVMASTYVIGRANIEGDRVKARSKFSAQLKSSLLASGESRWKETLNWNKSNVMAYAEFLKLYYSSKMDTDDTNYSMHAKNSLWPFTVWEFERAALGTMQGANNTETDVAGASKTQKVIGGALTGAVGGAIIGAEEGSVGGWWGAAIGAVVGGIAGSLG